MNYLHTQSPCGRWRQTAWRDQELHMGHKLRFGCRKQWHRGRMVILVIPFQTSLAWGQHGSLPSHKGDLKTFLDTFFSGLAIKILQTTFPPRAHKTEHAPCRDCRVGDEWETYSWRNSVVCRGEVLSVVSCLKILYGEIEMEHCHVGINRN